MSKNRNHVAPSVLPQNERDLWQEGRIKDLWRVFRVMGEFVEGFESMSHMGPCVSIFGSSRTKPGDPYYEMASQLARELVNRGFGVITGGGPGIMEAGNKGAQEAGGLIQHPHQAAVCDMSRHEATSAFEGL